MPNRPGRSLAIAIVSKFGFWGSESPRLKVINVRDRLFLSSRKKLIRVVARALAGFSLLPGLQDWCGLPVLHGIFL
jgi:hypothetical protein